MKSKLISILTGMCMIMTILPQITFAAESAPDGSESNPIEISTAQQLAELAAEVNSGNDYHGKFIRLMNDIDLSTVCGVNIDGAKVNWTPIGISSDTPFIGTFDGSNHRITGLYIEDPAGEHKGLFGCVDSKGDTSSGSYVRYEGTVKNLSVAGSVTGNMDVGGVVGYADGSNIINCSYEGSVSGTYYVGGVAGQNVGGTLENCCNTGSVKSINYEAGGVVGENYGGRVINCYNTGTVSGSYKVGGVVGRNASSGTVASCYNTGSVSGGTQTGGVVGENASDGTVTNCYYLTGAASGGINGADSTGSAEAKPNEKFTSGEAAYLLNGSKSNGVWKQTLDGDTYPGFTGLMVGYDENTGKYYNLWAAYTNTVEKKIDTTMTKDGSRPLKKSKNNKKTWQFGSTYGII